MSVQLCFVRPQVPKQQQDRRVRAGRTGPSGLHAAGPATGPKPDQSDSREGLPAPEAHPAVSTFFFFWDCRQRAVDCASAGLCASLRGGNISTGFCRSHVRERSQSGSSRVRGIHRMCRFSFVHLYTAQNSQCALSISCHIWCLCVPAANSTGIVSVRWRA